MNPKLTAALVVSVTVAIVLLAVTSTYSAWVSSKQHHNSCLARAASADALDQLITFVFTPKAGTTQTVAQVQATQRFETQAFAIVDKQRC